MALLDGVESLMPKGVEHPMKKYKPLNLKRVESLMPKGVEHLNYLDLPYKELHSVESLMPKGVEHREGRYSLSFARVVSNL